MVFRSQDEFEMFFLSNDRFEFKSMEGLTTRDSAPRLEGNGRRIRDRSGRTLAITLEGGRLHGQQPGGGMSALARVSGTTFPAGGSPLTLTFMLDANGRASAVVMRRNGRERTLPRVAVTTSAVSLPHDPARGLCVFFVPSQR
jgi:hypothetical protein